MNVGINTTRGKSRNVKKRVNIGVVTRSSKYFKNKGSGFVHVLYKLVSSEVQVPND